MELTKNKNLKSGKVDSSKMFYTDFFIRTLSFSEKTGIIEKIPSKKNYVEVEDQFLLLVIEMLAICLTNREVPINLKKEYQSLVSIIKDCNTKQIAKTSTMQYRLNKLSRSIEEYENTFDESLINDENRRALSEITREIKSKNVSRDNDRLDKEERDKINKLTEVISLKAVTQRNVVSASLVGK